MTAYDRPFLPQDLVLALALLTRLPVRVAPDIARTRGARAAWAWPLAGLPVALIAGGIGWLALQVGLSTGLAAGLALVAQVSLTGAMHEDGLADSVDGLWGGWDKARRLEIMKDSRIGSYGVLALILSLGLRWSAIAAFGAALLPALLAAAALSRAAMVLVMGSLPNARGAGLAHSVGRPDRIAGAMAALLAVLVAVAALGPAGLSLAIAALVAAGLAGAIARAKIGGQTGDILGATQQLAEIACLMTATLLVS